MQTQLKKSTLVIAPHADDEIFGCGGTILRLLDEGAEVSVMVMVAGDIKFQHSNDTVTATQRVEEFEKVMKFCGVSKFGVLNSMDNLDGKLDTVPLSKLIGQIEEVQRKFRADRWLIPGPSFHQDHEIVNKAAVAAGRPFTTFAPKEILMYELPTYVYGSKHLSFQPTMFVDISQQLERKLGAVKLYESQIRPNTNALSLERLKDWAVMRGAQSNCPSAEAFEVLHSLV